MSYVEAIKFLDSTGAVQAFKWNTDAPQVCSQPYLQALAEGDISGHAVWSKIGYNGALVASTEADLWSATGSYVFPTSAQAMEIVSADNTQDIGAIIKGDATGDTVTSDAGGSTTTLLDADVDFTAATAVAAGDCVILDPHGTSPEWGYVTTVAAHTLTVAGGFSAGGSGTSRKYAVIDKSAYTGAQVLKIEYLDGSYAEKKELCVLNGTTAVATINTNLFRIQSFRVVATGTDNKPKGNLSLRATADTPVYSFISAGYTRARNSAYTVPASKTLYVVQFTVSYGYSHNSTHYCRITTRANIEQSSGFNTGSIFYPFTEVVCANSSQGVQLETPTKLPAKTDIKVSAIADYAGIATVALRGWIE